MEEKPVKPTIKQLREAQGLSQHRLAALAEVSPTTITRMELGKPVLRISFLSVCRALKTKPGDVELPRFSSLRHPKNKH